MRFCTSISIGLMFSSAYVLAQQPSVDAPPLPIWLQEKIVQLKKLPPHAARSIYRTLYKERVAYYFSPICCDIPSELYDESGRLLCYPDGGFAGGDGKCPTFVASPPLLSPIWPDAKQGKNVPTKK